MSATIIEYLVMFLSIAAFAGCIVGQIFWLTRNGWATAGKAAAFALISDISAGGLTLVLWLTFGMVGFMMVMGPAGKGSDVPEAAYILLIIACLLAPFVLFILSKRIMLALLGIGTGSSAWTFSLAASVLIIIAAYIIPGALFFAVLKYWK